MKAQVLKQLNTTEKQQSQLEAYEALLIKWQGVKNLVGNTTLEHLWERHFLDSALLLPYLKDKKCLVDCGTGAGFPGLVIAIMKPDIDIHLVESNQRKCAFLREVIRVTGVKATVHCERVEDVVEDFVGKADCVTARALASLNELLKMTEPLLINGAEGLFLKGIRGEDEVNEAKRFYDFKVETFPSLTQDLSALFRLTELKKV